MSRDDHVDKPWSEDVVLDLRQLSHDFDFTKKLPTGIRVVEVVIYALYGNYLPGFSVLCFDHLSESSLSDLVKDFVILSDDLPLGVAICRRLALLHVIIVFLK